MIFDIVGCFTLCKMLIMKKELFDSTDFDGLFSLNTNENHGETEGTKGVADVGGD
jgi:hypothetical protein